MREIIAPQDGSDFAARLEVEPADLAELRLRWITFIRALAAFLHSNKISCHDPFRRRSSANRHVSDRAQIVRTRRTI